jgi:hypothetical protein
VKKREANDETEIENNERSGDNNTRNEPKDGGPRGLDGTTNLADTW